MIKKPLIIIVPIFFIVVFYFMFWGSKNMYTKRNGVEPPEVLAAQVYLVKHSKNLKEKFVVDSIAYTANNFTFYRNLDTVTLFVEMLFENTTINSRIFTDSFFELKRGLKEKFYPILNPFTVFENGKQPLKLMYKMATTGLPYEDYYLHIVSKKDTATNALVNFYKSFREGG